MLSRYSLIFSLVYFVYAQNMHTRNGNNMYPQAQQHPIQNMNFNRHDNSFDHDDLYDNLDIYQNEHMLQPIYPISNSNSSISTQYAVLAQVQLKSYVDQGLKLPGGMTCVCPLGFLCSYLGTSSAGCFISFTFIISSPDTSVRYMSTGFYPLTSSGTIDLSRMNARQLTVWQQPFKFYLTSKPSAIDVFVHHLGVVINAQNGELTKMQTVVHVDTFILPLKNVAPSINSQQMETVQLTGTILETKLSISYLVQCLGSLLGPNCDLSCNKSSNSASVAICQSNSTCFFYTCSYTAGGQVQNCQSCPWGIAQSSYCSSSTGGVLNPVSARVVSSGFRVATIILGIVSGVLLLLLLLVIIYSCVIANRRAQERDPEPRQNAPGHNHRSTMRSDGSAERPLLQQRPAARIPTPTSRLNPSLNILPTKSSLKSPPIPAAHLGGGSSLNDTLNSSLNSVPLPPSKEADV